MIMRHALFGATGTVGKALAPVLAEANVAFRVVGRSIERLKRDFENTNHSSSITRPI